MPILFPKERDYTVSVKEALKNCPASPGQEYPASKKEILKLIPAGGYWKDLPLNLQKKYMKASFYMGGGKTGMARRLSWDQPSLTLTCSPGTEADERCHPKDTFFLLTVREYEDPDISRLMGICRIHVLGQSTDRKRCSRESGLPISAAA